MLFERVQSEMSHRDGMRLILYTWFWSFFMLAAVPIAAIYTGVGTKVFSNLLIIWTTPSQLVTDYFYIGGLASAFLNAGICGLACNIIMTITKVRPTATVLAGYFLVIAHCFYGLNFINMWPPFLGVMLFCYFRKEKLGPSLHLAMFSTALGPFISEFLFRYTLGETYVFGEPRITISGCILAIVFGLLAGFIIPTLLPGTTKTHKGHNLYKAGLAIGIFGMFAYGLFFKTFGVATPNAKNLVLNNPIYDAHDNSYIIFMDVFFVLIFGITFLWGFFTNGKTLRGYGKILKCDGWNDNFPKEFGMPVTLINIGIYGLCILAYFNIIMLVNYFTGFPGEGYTGATAGVTIAAITFAASGQTPANTWPIAVGYVLIFGITYAFRTLCGLDLTWSLATQSYMNGFAFATGLCPFTGHYGKKIGIVAGALNCILCTCTSAMHGGFVLYNGGLTAGLTALVLLPVLEFFEMKPHPGFEHKAIEDK